MRFLVSSHLESRQTLKQTVFSKKQLKIINPENLKSVEDLASINIEISGMDSDNQTSTIYLSNKSDEKISVEMSPSQISHFLFFSHHKTRLEKNFFRTPYDQLLDFIDFIGGEAKNVSIIGKKYEILWGVMLISLGGETISISMPAADALIYAVIKKIPIKITKEIFNDNSINFEE